VRQSYFSQILGKTRWSVLKPPRPVSTLWKAARLEQFAVESAARVAPSGPRRELLPPVPTPESTGSETRLAGAPQRPPRSLEAARPPRTQRETTPASRPVGVGLRPTARRLDQPKPVASNRSRWREPEVASISTASAPPELTTHSEAYVPPSTPPPPEEPAKPAAAFDLDVSPAQTPRSACAPGRPNAAERRNPPVQSELTSLFAQRQPVAAVPLRPLEPGAAPGPQQPNSIHVGRIEVEVVSPTPITRSVVLQRAGRLAHGYALRLGASRT
jgi:hypothetical protein